MGVRIGVGCVFVINVFVERRGRLSIEGYRSVGVFPILLGQYTLYLGMSPHAPHTQGRTEELGHRTSDE